MKSDHMIIVNFDDMEWNKEGHTLKGYAKQFGGSFPHKFGVKSPWTGRVVTFEMMKEGDALLDPDFWDGEIAGYRPIASDKGIKIDAVFLSHGM